MVALESEIEGQLNIFDFPEYLPEGKEKRKAELLKKYGKDTTLSPAELYYVETGRADYWQNGSKKRGEME